MSPCFVSTQLAFRAHQLYVSRRLQPSRTRNGRSILTCVVQAPPSRKPQQPRIETKRAAVRPKKDPELHAESDSLQTTRGERAKVAAFFGLLFANIVKVWLTSNWDLRAVADTSVSAVLGWLFADFGTCFYHWAVDNYGNEDTPIFGFQIAAFQGHHTSPWTITNRSFANNLHRLTNPTTPQLIMLLLLPLPPAVLTGLTSALFWIVMSQEFHKQAHMSRPAPYARVLQRLGVVVSRLEHGLHHSSPYGGHYGIVSGVWNRILDDNHVFRRLEAFIYRRNGVEPIAWKLDPQLKRKSLSL